MNFSILFLVFLSPAAVVTVMLQLEAESVSERHARIRRSNASNFTSIRITVAKDSISVPVCFYRTFNNAILTVVYSNDGSAEVVVVKVNGAEIGSFTSIAGPDFGNKFRSVHFNGVTVKRGYNMLTLTFERMSHGIEIDYVGFSVDDDFMTEEVLHCQLMIGVEPQFQVAKDAIFGELYQDSHKTVCPEESNVQLSVVQPFVRKYTLTATRPLYRTMYDIKTSDTSKCPYPGYIFWKFEDIITTPSKTAWKPSLPSTNHNKAKMTSSLSDRDPVYHVIYTVAFRLKGFSQGLIDADIWTDLIGKFFWNGIAGTSIPTVRISYVDRHGKEKVLETFTMDQLTVNKKWSVPEMTWSEERQNTVTIKVTDPKMQIKVLELDRGYTGPNRAVDLYKSNAVVLQGWSTDFWWRRPLKQNLTVTVGGKTTRNLFSVALYVPVPWTGQSSIHQIFVLYQDGTVRLVPPPITSPYPNKWTPFGTSVIVGKSDPSAVRPAASIESMTFHPETLTMDLKYYDNSSCKLTLSCNMSQTSLEVTNLHFTQSSNWPFASFRSMFVAFKKSDCDSVQSTMAGHQHVMGNWSQLKGQEFLVFRTVESHHLTQSPDIRLTIDEA